MLPRWPAAAVCLKGASPVTSKWLYPKIEARMRRVSLRDAMIRQLVNAVIRQLVNASIQQHIMAHRMWL